MVQHNVRTTCESRFHLSVAHWALRVERLFQSSWDNLRSHSSVGKNLQQYRMRNSSVDKLDFLYTAFDCSRRTIDFWDHPLGNDAGPPEGGNFRCGKVADQRGAVCGVAQQSRDVAHENQPARFQCYRYFRRGNVRIAIVDFAVIAARRGTDYRSDAAPDALAQRFHAYTDNFADKTKINLFIGR